MAEFRQWLHAQLSKLDGARERKIVGIGALALLVFLNVGPSVLRAAASAITSYKPAERPAPRTTVLVMPSRENGPEDSATHTEQEKEDVPPLPELPSAPPLAFLFPLSGAEVSGPVTIGVRIENATAVAILFEMTNPAGERVATLPAVPTASGEWNALWNAAPGTYVAGARASLEDGRVVVFAEQRAFHVAAGAPQAPPADPSEPLVELTSPDGQSAFDALVPLSARVKNAEPTNLVFIVTAPDGYETLVLGMPFSNTGYWTAMFEGARGTYRVRARAAFGERHVFSTEAAMVLNGGTD